MSTNQPLGTVVKVLEADQSVRHFITLEKSPFLATVVEGVRGSEAQALLVHALLHTQEIFAAKDTILERIVDCNKGADEYASDRLNQYLNQESPDGTTTSLWGEAFDVAGKLHAYAVTIRVGRTGVAISSVFKAL